MGKNRLKITAFSVAFAVLSATAGHAAAPSSAYCKNLLASMASKPKARAMALSADGQICSAFWGERSQANADRKATAGCQDGGKRKCSIVKR
ncbi:MAG: hypothetical protein AB7P20_05470 [Rhizobiaceae bacterium]